MNILVSGGGSGGHVSPSLAVATWFRGKQYRVVYIGTRGGLEENLAKNAGLPFFAISAGKLPRYASLQALRTPFQTIKGIFQARKILRKEKITVVFAAGGFVTLPVGIAAWLTGTPLVVNEADSYPGLTTRFLSKFARKVCVAFDSSVKFFPQNKVVLTGLPLQPDSATGNKARAKKMTKLNLKRPNLLVIGGSQGAQVLNAVVYAALPRLTKFCNVIHLTGPKNPLQKRNTTAYFSLTQADHQTLADLYAISDLALTRAGSNTLFELALNGIPPIIVPLPSAAGDHQSKNAEYFTKREAGVLLRQETLTAEKLVDKVRKILQDKKHQQTLRTRLKQIDSAHNLERVCRTILAASK